MQLSGPLARTGVRDRNVSDIQETHEKFRLGAKRSAAIRTHLYRSIHHAPVCIAARPAPEAIDQPAGHRIGVGIAKNEHINQQGEPAVIDVKHLLQRQLQHRDELTVDVTYDGRQEDDDEDDPAAALGGRNLMPTETIRSWP